MANSSRYYDDSIKLPAEIAHQVSLRAAELARQYAPRGPRNSRAKIRATGATGKIGVYVPPNAEHLLFLDQGIAPFIMYDLEGKTIPIRNADGSISFRKAKGVGTTRISARNAKGQIVGSEKKWKHPGTKALNFIEKALDQAVSEWVDSLQSEDVLELLNQFPEFRGLMEMLSVTVSGRVNFQQGS